MQVPSIFFHGIWWMNSIHGLHFWKLCKISIYRWYRLSIISKTFYSERLFWISDMEKDKESPIRLISTEFQQIVLRLRKFSHCQSIFVESCIVLMEDDFFVCILTRVLELFSYWKLGGVVFIRFPLRKTISNRLMVVSKRLPYTVSTAVLFRAW